MGCVTLALIAAARAALSARIARRSAATERTSLSCARCIARSSCSWNCCGMPCAAVAPGKGSDGVCLGDACGSGWVSAAACCGLIGAPGMGVLRRAAGAGGSGGFGGRACAGVGRRAPGIECRPVGSGCGVGWRPVRVSGSEGVCRRAPCGSGAGLDCRGAWVCVDAGKMPYGWLAATGMCRPLAADGGRGGGVERRCAGRVSMGVGRGRMQWGVVSM